MLKVVKIGGNIVDNPEKLERFLQDFATLPAPKILVHGGGKIATQVSKGLGIEAQMIDGRRVTDAETLNVVTMVYAGLINKTIVSKLQKYGCDAIGMSGADGNFMLSERRKPTPIDYGYVGDPLTAGVNTELIGLLVDHGYTLVAAPITLDTDEFSLLNTNADTVAQTIATALSSEYETELVYCFEKKGVLRNIADEDSVIPVIRSGEFSALKEQGIIADGMIPKLENAFKAIGNGVKQVVICSAEAVCEPGYGGTTLAP